MVPCTTLNSRLLFAGFVIVTPPCSEVVLKKFTVSELATDAPPVVLVPSTLIFHPAKLSAHPKSASVKFLVAIACITPSVKVIVSITCAPDVSTSVSVPIVGLYSPVTGML